MQVRDSLPFSIGFSLDGGPICTMTNSILFPKGQPIPSSKILTFQRCSLFHLEAFYANPNELPPGAPSKIGCFTVCAHFLAFFEFIQDAKYFGLKLALSYHQYMHCSETFKLFHGHLLQISDFCPT